MAECDLCHRTLHEKLHPVDVIYGAFLYSTTTKHLCENCITQCRRVYGKWMKSEDNAD